MNKKDKSCTINKFMRYFGFTGHKWKYTSEIHRKCIRCDVKQRMVDYDAFYTIWKIIE